MKLFFQKIAKLIDVKSLLTITFGVFYCIMAYQGRITPDLFQATFTVMIGFYFGVQATKERTHGKDKEV